MAKVGKISGQELNEQEKANQSNPPFVPEGQSKTTKVKKDEQTFTIISKENYPVLFGAGPISTVASIDEAVHFVWLPQSWELRLPKTDTTAYPKTYSITSEVPILDEAVLRSGAAAQPAVKVDPMYLQLPSNFLSE